MRWIDFDHAVTERVNHPRPANLSENILLGANHVNVPVKTKLWLKAFDQPAKSFDSMVRQVILVMHAGGRCMCHEYVQEATVL